MCTEVFKKQSCKLQRQNAVLVVNICYNAIAYFCSHPHPWNHVEYQLQYVNVQICRLMYEVMCYNIAQYDSSRPWLSTEVLFEVATACNAILSCSCNGYNVQSSALQLLFSSTLVLLCFITTPHYFFVSTEVQWNF